MGHATHTGGRRHPYNILVGQAAGKRPLQNHRRRREKVYLKGIEYVVVKQMFLDPDVVQHRDAVNVVMKFLVP
jgi:hypothetical protein